MHLYSPITSIGEQEDLIRRAFSKKAVCDGQDLIECGVNPFLAWMYVRRIDVKAMAFELDLRKRIGDFAMPAEIAGQDPVSVMRQIMRGLFMPDAGTIHDFCLVLSITPDQLHPRDSGLPAPAEIVEAAVRHVQETRHLEAVSEGLVDFLAGEVQRADHYGGRRLSRDHAVNLEILDGALARFADSRLRCVKDWQGPDDVLHETMTPVQQIMDIFKEAIAHEQDYLQTHIETSKDVRGDAAHSRTLNNRIIDACATQLARQGQRVSFLKAANVLARRFGAEEAALIMREAPEKELPLRPFWRSSASVVLPDGMAAVGGNVLKAFCRAMTGFYHDDSILRRMSAQEAAARADYRLFAAWRRVPETEMFLLAEANRRHILGHVEREEMGMIIHLPMLRANLLPGPVRKTV